VREAALSPRFRPVGLHLQYLKVDEASDSHANLPGTGTDTGTAICELHPPTLSCIQVTFSSLGHTHSSSPPPSSSSSSSLLLAHEVKRCGMLTSLAFH